MDLFLELIFTVSLSLIFTSLFIKLASMQLPNTDKNKLMEETFKIDKFQRMPFKADQVIKLQECPNEGKSLVKLYSNELVGVVLENKIQEVVIVDNEKYDHDDKDENSDCKDRVMTTSLEKNVSPFSQENSDMSCDMSEISKDNIVNEIGSVLPVTEMDLSSLNNDMMFGLEEENIRDRDLCEIEIESVGEEEEELFEIGIMDDWEEIGRKDYEELLGNKAELYYVDVEFEK